MFVEWWWMFFCFYLLFIKRWYVCRMVMYVYLSYTLQLTILKVVNYLQKDGTLHKMSGIVFIRTYVTLISNKVHHVHVQMYKQKQNDILITWLTLAFDIITSFFLLCTYYLTMRRFFKEIFMLCLFILPKLCKFC